MMDSRAQFEAWLRDTNPALYELAYCWDEEEDEVVYSAKATVLDLRTGWDAAWQESRAAIEVELPAYRDATTHGFSAFNDALDICETELRNHGISIKGKSS